MLGLRMLTTQDLHGVALLALLLICSLIAGCPQRLVSSSGSSKLEHSAGEASGDQAAADAGQPLAPDERSLSEAEIETIWLGLSSLQRTRLEAEGYDLRRMQILGGGLTRTELHAYILQLFEGLPASEMHEPGLVIGDAIKWRELDHFDGSYEDYASLLAGNFDDDPDRELLHVTQYTCSILELDGSLRELPILGWIGGKLELAWDWDGDGIMEIVTRGYGPEQPGPDTMQILNLAGEVVAELPGSLPIASSGTADLDGNGHRELLLEGGGRTGLAAYGLTGLESWYVNALAANIVLAIGDFDGDGRDELLGRSVAEQSPTGLGLLRVFGLEQEFAVLPGLREAEASEHPYNAMDLNDDGVAEVITTDSIVNPADGSRTPLQIPKGWSGMDFGPFPAQLVAYQAGGRTLLAARVLEQQGSERSDTLILWDAQGQIVYHEQFADALDEILVLPGATGDRLVIMKADGIYVEQ